MIDTRSASDPCCTGAAAPQAQHPGESRVDPLWWAWGLHLAERCQLGVGADDDMTVPAANDAIAGQRLRAWHGGVAQITGDPVAALCAEHGISEDRLRRILAIDPRDLAVRAAEPSWARLADECLDSPAPMSEPIRRFAESTPWPGRLVSILAPFVDGALTLVTQSPAYRGALADGVVAPTVTTDIARYLTDRALSRFLRVLVLEINQTRRIGRHGDPGRSANRSPQDRFLEVTERLATPQGRSRLFRAYPAATRRLVVELDLAAQVIITLVERLHKDRRDIATELLRGVQDPRENPSPRSRRTRDAAAESVSGGNGGIRPVDPGAAVRVDLGTGDTHNGGAAVAIVTFANGERVVYKPRDLTVYEAWSELLGWYGAGLAERFRAPAVLARGDYGWMEFLESTPCTDEAQVDAFYRQLGSLLALLTVTVATDMHQENVIAAGANPVIVDLESLFHPHLGSPERDRRDPAVTALAGSVLRVGLLPSLSIGADGEAADMSGMGGDEGAMSPWQVPTIEGAGTDIVRIVRRRLPLSTYDNRPRLGERQADPSEYETALLAGFESGCEMLRSRPDTEARLDVFAAISTRVIARPTRIYATLIRESSHPDVGRDALDTDRVFSTLWAITPERDPRRRLVRDEIEAMWQGDIPAYVTEPGTTTVRNGAGRDMGVEVDAGGLALAHSCLDLLRTDRGLDEQIWTIRTSLSTRAQGRQSGGLTAPDEPVAAGRLGTVRWPRQPVRAAESADIASIAERALLRARDVGDAVLARAHRQDDRIGWLGLALVRDTAWTVGPLGADVYNGRPGVALALAELGHVLRRHGIAGADRFAEASAMALAPGIAVLEDLAEYASGVLPAARLSAFQGLLGLAHISAQTGRLLGLPERDDLLIAALNDAADAAPADTLYDVIGGSAGALLIAEHHSRYGSAQVRRAAAHLSSATATRIVETVLRDAEGQPIGWPASNADRPLGGFAHGIAGIACALLLRHARRTDPTACALALAVMAAEDATWDETIRTWPDLRRDSLSAAAATPPHMNAWCHGAPGIAVSRLVCSSVPVRSEADPARDPWAARDALNGEVARDRAVAADGSTSLRRAVASMVEQPIGVDHSLCHGALGNLDILGLIARNAEDPRLRDIVATRHADVAVALLDGLDAGPPACGTPRGLTTPGLMTGLGGIVHGLLRLGAPVDVAPMLTLGDQGLR